MNGVIGIDIGGTNVKVALISSEGKIMLQQRLSVASMAAGEVFLERLKSVISKMLLAETGCGLRGIGIGTPGANIAEGVIEKASNLPWDRLPIVSFLKKEFDCKVRITNDANLFAIGEKVFGKATNYSDFVVLTLGTGVGAGVYINGKLLSGRDGLAGELGHAVIAEKGRYCHCGRSGCLERYVSASGVVLTAREVLEDSGEFSILRKIAPKDLSSDKIAQAASQGDALALKVFEMTGNVLGQALANIEAYLNPEAIFLAGGLCQAGRLLVEPTIKSYHKNRLDIYPKELPILISSIADDQSGVLGAAAFVWDTLEQPNSLQTTSVI